MILLYINVFPFQPLYQPGTVFSYTNDGFMPNGTDRSETNGKIGNGISVPTMVEEINTENSQKVDDNYNESSSSDIIATLQRQLQVIKNIEKNLQEKKRMDAIIEEWQLLAQVLDRVFLLFFFSFMSISTMAILFRSTHGPSA